MSNEHLAEIIRQIEELQAMEPPGPRGDNKPPTDIGSLDWWCHLLASDHRPTVGGKAPDSLKNLINAAYNKGQTFEDAGDFDRAKKWMDAGTLLTAMCIEKYGWDAMQTPEKLRET